MTWQNLSGLGVLKDEARGRLRPKKRLAPFFERFGSARFSRPGLDLSFFLPQRPGFFVEAGAYDGYTESNTYYLARFKGWRGILIEPIPDLYRQCVRRRPESLVVNCGLVGAEYQDDEVVMQFGGAMSVVKGAWESAADNPVAPVPQSEWSARGLLLGQRPYEVRVPARTLTSVLDQAHAPIPNLLSLDVEGYEADVLRGLDLDRYGPALIVLECYGAFGATLAELDALLGARYERVAEIGAADFVYRRY